MRPTQAHYNAVTESPRMLHQFLRLYQEVSQHLHGLRILKRYMFLLTPSFMKLLMHELSKQSPFFPTVHQQKVVAPGDEIMSDIGLRAVAIDGRFLVQEGFYNARISYYDRGRGTKFERNYGTVFLGPFCESGWAFSASINIRSASSLYHTGNALQFLEVDEGFQ